MSRSPKRRQQPRRPQLLSTALRSWFKQSSPKLVVVAALTLGLLILLGRMAASPRWLQSAVYNNTLTGRMQAFAQLDSTATFALEGWACDFRDARQAVPITVYQGPREQRQAKEIVRGTADQPIPRPDDLLFREPSRYCRGNHAFRFIIPVPGPSDVNRFSLYGQLIDKPGQEIFLGDVIYDRPAPAPAPAPTPSPCPTPALSWRGIAQRLLTRTTTDCPPAARPTAPPAASTAPPPAQTPAARCGNAIREAGEQCDSGQLNIALDLANKPREQLTREEIGTLTRAGCLATCQWAQCNDGKDNDGDEFVDNADAACRARPNADAATMVFIRGHNSEADESERTATNLCHGHRDTACGLPAGTTVTCGGGNRGDIPNQEMCCTTFVAHADRRLRPDTQALPRTWHRKTGTQTALTGPSCPQVCYGYGRAVGLVATGWTARSRAFEDAAACIVRAQTQCADTGKDWRLGTSDEDFRRIGLFLGYELELAQEYYCD